MMTKNEQIEISLNKTKMIISLIGAIVFVILGLELIFHPYLHNISFKGSRVIPIIIGLTSILFFGLISIFLIKKLSDKTAGLIINEDGIVDNSSGVSAGTVLWSDIKEIKVSHVMNQKFLMLIVHNPQDYLDRVSSKFKRKTMELNYKNYGSPISIPANTLKIKFSNLHELLTTKMKEYKQ